MTHSWSRSAATGVIMVLFIVTQCCYYSAAISTNGFKEVVDSGKKGIDKIMNQSYLNRTGLENREKFVKVLEDLCSFYQSINDYKDITFNDSSNVTQAIRIVLNETYNDSCNWLRDNLGDTGYDCAEMNSRHVTELCITVETAATTNGLADKLEEVVEDMN